jgi:hypothetical protein
MTELHVGSVLTPMAAAISGFTVSAFSLVSNGAWALAIQTMLTSDNGLDASYHTVVVWIGGAQVLLAFLGLALAQRVLATTLPADAARHLAGAAVVVGGIGLLVGLLTMLSGAV